MKKNIKLLSVMLIVSSLFITKNLSAQLPGSLIPLIVAKKATGYWDDNQSEEIVANNPDTDGDGIVDSKDDCPTVKGTKANNGCPEPLDSDNDGVIDKKDDCPYVKGKIENDGCPLTKTEMLIIYDVTEKVHFELESAKLDTKSKKELDRLAKLLKEHPEIAVEIEGHTDNTGSKELNEKLSKERAMAVKNYLDKKAGPLNNVSVSAHDYEEPIATNKTKKGRAKNRRAEIEIRLVELIK